jgi:hypothetical protein
VLHFAHTTALAGLSVWQTEHCMDCGVDLHELAYYDPDSLEIKRRFYLSPLSIVSRAVLAFHQSLTASELNSLDSLLKIHGNAKLKRALPAATATYCFPSIANDIGDEYPDAPHWKCHGALPEAASSAMTFPAASP